MFNDSYKPGAATPTIMLFSPLLTTLPLLIVTFLLLSELSVVAKAIVNGV